jgi:hypothetical protein
MQEKVKLKNWTQINGKCSIGSREDMRGAQRTRELLDTAQSKQAQ